MSEAALRVFEYGQREAAKRGLLLVDTKYEFGKDAHGHILLVDEIHTPDSSRYDSALVFALYCCAAMSPFVACGGEGRKPLHVQGHAETNPD